MLPEFCVINDPDNPSKVVIVVTTKPGYIDERFVFNTVQEFLDFLKSRG